MHPHGIGDGRWVRIDMIWYKIRKWFFFSFLSQYNWNLLRRKHSVDSFFTQAVRWRRRKRKKRRRLWRRTFHLMRSTFDTHNNNKNNYMKTKPIKAHEISQMRIMMKNHKNTLAHTTNSHLNRTRFSVRLDFPSRRIWLLQFGNGIYVERLLKLFKAK